MSLEKSGLTRQREEAIDAFRGRIAQRGGTLAQGPEKRSAQIFASVTKGSANSRNTALFFYSSQTVQFPVSLLAFCAPELDIQIPYRSF